MSEYVTCPACNSSGIAVDEWAGPGWQSVKVSVNVDDSEPKMMSVEFKNLDLTLGSARWEDIDAAVVQLAKAIKGETDRKTEGYRQ